MSETEYRAMQARLSQLQRKQAEAEAAYNYQLKQLLEVHECKNLKQGADRLVELEKRQEKLKDQLCKMLTKFDSALTKAEDAWTQAEAS